MLSSLAVPRTIDAMVAVSSTGRTSSARSSTSSRDQRADVQRMQPRDERSK
jgi:hypothetical protein